METINIKGIDEEIFYVVSNSGLPIYIWKNENARSFYLSLNVLYGSIDTEFKIKDKKYKVPDGIAHFMEHIKFNVDKDTTANDLFDKLGSEINAFTTFKYTSYIVYGTNKIDDNLNNLLDFVYNPYFTKEKINKEKGIIISEVNMGKDNPFNTLYFEFNKCLYEKLKFRNLITGEVKDVKSIDIKDIKTIYDAFYHPKNMFLVVTGNVNPFEIEKIVNENLEKKDIGKYLNPEKIRIKEPRSVYKKEEIINFNVEVEKGKLGLKIPKKNFKINDDVKLNIILSLILNNNFGDSSILKEELLQEDLITYLSASRFVLDDYVVVDITFESKYSKEVFKRLENALNNLIMDEEDLKRKINASVANLVTGFDDVEEVNNMIGTYIVNYGSLIPNIKEIYEAITLEDVISVMNAINTKEMTKVIMKK